MKPEERELMKMFNGHGADNDEYDRLIDKLTFEKQRKEGLDGDRETKT